MSNATRHASCHEAWGGTPRPAPFALHGRLQRVLNVTALAWGVPLPQARGAARPARRVGPVSPGPRTVPGGYGFAISY